MCEDLPAPSMPSKVMNRPGRDMKTLVESVVLGRCNRALSQLYRAVQARAACSYCWPRQGRMQLLLAALVAVDGAVVLLQ